VVAYADGGGKTQTFLRPMCGRGRIARLTLRFGTWLELLGAEGMRLAEVNGQPAVFLGHDGRLVLVVSLDIAEGLVQIIRPSAIRTSCVTSTRGPVAPGRLIAELQFDVPRQLQERSSGLAATKGGSCIVWEIRHKKEGGCHEDIRRGSNRGGGPAARPLLVQRG
jgi:hypothetical protein